MNYSRIILGSAIVALLSGCGGGAEQEIPVKHNQFLASTTTSDYRSLVQQLYLSYFGRPADTGGFESFKNQLAAIGGPTNIQLLVQAYKTDARIKSLVDSFGSSAESAALYGGDNTAFVTAIYQNVLGRAPDAEGLKFWVGAINSGDLSRARGSLDIMAGALANNTAQGVRDATLVNKKITVALNFTDALLAAPVNGYSGDGAAAQARTLLSTVTEFTDIATSQSLISSLVNSLATPSSVTLSRPPDIFFGGNSTAISWPYSSSGIANANVSCIGSGCSLYYKVDSFQLVAIGRNYTINNMQAVNLTSGSKIQPFFDGLSNGQVIEAGKTVAFKLQSPLTGGATVTLRYSFTILETGDIFNYDVQLKTN